MFRLHNSTKLCRLFPKNVTATFGNLHSLNYYLLLERRSVVLHAAGEGGQRCGWAAQQETWMGLKGEAKAEAPLSCVLFSVQQGATAHLMAN